MAMATVADVWGHSYVRRLNMIFFIFLDFSYKTEAETKALWIMIIPQDQDMPLFNEMLDGKAIKYKL